MKPDLIQKKDSIFLDCQPVHGPIFSYLVRKLTVAMEEVVMSQLSDFGYWPNSVIAVIGTTDQI
ncbi:MAG: hypothetical protein QG652_597 [Pseudomonadota bacterium]|nr:hypothetical protein [Pseudomonadota bacterium]